MAGLSVGCHCEQSLRYTSALPDLQMRVAIGKHVSRSVRNSGVFFTLSSGLWAHAAKLLYLALLCSSYTAIVIDLLRESISSPLRELK